jgi:hypothetical protein
MQVVNRQEKKGKMRERKERSYSHESRSMKSQRRRVRLEMFSYRDWERMWATGANLRDWRSNLEGHYLYAESEKQRFIVYLPVSDNVVVFSGFLEDAWN